MRIDAHAPKLAPTAASGLPESDVHYTLVDLFVAGVNTVSSSLEWMLLLTADDTIAQERARLDARRIGVAGGGGDRSYTDALLHETMRLKPPLLLPRVCVAPGGSTIGGFHVGRGTVVLANNHALTSSPLLWREPQLFRPERFLAEERKLSMREASGSVEACKFIPFSIGQRACPGSRLACAELEAAATGLLRSVRWRRDATIDLSESYSLTLSPSIPQRLRFERVAPSGARPPHTPRRAASATKRTPVAAMSQSAARREDRTPGRATRRQKISSLDETRGMMPERLAEAGTDRRGGWRESKAKGNRRNRRYEKRLLSGVAGAALDLDEDD